MKNVTELVIIIDKSGSMTPLRDDVVGGFNSLIEDRKKEGETLVTTVFFDDDRQLIHNGVDIKEIKPLTNKDYCPSGCTALLDTIGYTINLIKDRHSKTKAEDLPKCTIFSIMTDGYENVSRNFSYKDIKNMVSFQRECGWEFIFQGANIDAFDEAEKLGINKEMAMEFKADSEGIVKATCFINSKVSAIAKEKDITHKFNYSDQISE